MKKIIQINSVDNVAVALIDLIAGELCTIDEDTTVILQENIPRGHKFALHLIQIDQNVVKYGSPIGHAICNIPAGSWVHNHNIKTNLSDFNEYIYQPLFSEISCYIEQRVFNGYVRHDGRVGIRNELWIIPTVGCVNGVANQIKDKFLQQLGGVINLFNVDCINVLSHNYGCSQLGDDHVNTRTILAAAAKHPNCGGALVLGLGCENNTMLEFVKSLGVFDNKRLKFLITQEVSDEVASGLTLVNEIYQEIIHDKRTLRPLSDLHIGLKCGASDGLSGITANPLVGSFSDFIIANGGTTILTEVPEMFGAEHILMRRAKNQKVFSEIVDLINEFKQYFIKHNQPIYENPSPGNKAGGISTLEDKSLGCTQKAGVAQISAVLKYGEQITCKGLNLLNAPGNDLVASTALAASGCQMVLFTTGRGTPFGCIVPTVKIATNSKIANLKPQWIDFDSGKLLENINFERLLIEFIDFIVEIASGKWVNNEKNNARELAIFKTGVTL